MSFPQFSKLPFELQDMIWTLFIHISLGTAHYARLDEQMIRDPNSTGGVAFATDMPPFQLYLTRSRISKFYSSRCDSITTLLQTTKSSRVTAQRFLKASPKASAGNCIPLDREFPYERIVIPLPALRINAFNNLIIFADIAHNIWGNMLHSRPNISRYSQPGHIRYLAIPFPVLKPSYRRSMQLRDDVALILSALLEMFGDLHVLYVLIHPERLRSGMNKPWGKTDWSDPQNPDITLASYLDAYGKISPIKCKNGGGIYRCGQQEFFEVPAEQVAHLGGLEWLIGILAKTSVNFARRLRENENENESAKLRLMSWTDLV
ncbi:hypothetical protein EMCG_00283 [[Emmonsia] crescens]|uniref:2EXR domain-containing protein n=1 Tax=[Emmonsia] crescens TaxID=73230 RepID=A0A0G2HZM1_9EURO|nr:hypothetical protein EMCG_00283 [Emmonsia crescens UAMH 3008]